MIPSTTDTNEIYGFLVKNDLTTKSQEDFLNEYSNPEKAKELHKFFVDNELTTKTNTEFYDTYLKKKESTQPQVSSQPGIRSLNPTYNIGAVQGLPNLSKQSDLEPLSTEINTPSKTPETFSEALADENINKGSRIGYIYNKLLRGVSSYGATAMDLLSQIAVKIPGATAPGITPEEGLKTIREELLPAAREGVKEKLGVSISDEKQKKYDEEFLTSAIGGLASSVPAMVSPYGAGLFLQAYDSGLESIENTEVAPELSETTKTSFAVTVGLAQGILERYGLSKIFGKNSLKIANNLAAKTLADMMKKSGEKITKESFEKALEVSVKTLKNRALEMGRAGLIEFETGGLQEISTILAERGLNAATDKNIFDEQSFGDMVGRVLYAAGQEAVGGLTLGLFKFAAPSKARNYIKERVMNATSDEEVFALKQEISNQMADGSITQEVADEAISLVEEYNRVKNRIPDTVTDKAAVVDAILEKEDIQATAEAKTAEAAEVDDAFRPEIEKEVDALNSRAEELNEEIINPPTNEELKDKQTSEASSKKEKAQQAPDSNIKEVPVEEQSFTLSSGEKYNTYSELVSSNPKFKDIEILKKSFPDVKLTNEKSLPDSVEKEEVSESETDRTTSKETLVASKSKPSKVEEKTIEEKKPENKEKRQKPSGQEVSTEKSGLFSLLKRVPQNKLRSIGMSKKESGRFINYGEIPSFFFNKRDVSISEIADVLNISKEELFKEVKGEINKIDFDEKWEKETSSEEPKYRLKVWAEYSQGNPTELGDFYTEKAAQREFELANEREEGREDENNNITLEKYNDKTGEYEEIDSKNLPPINETTRELVYDVQKEFGDKYSNITLPNGKTLNLRISDHSANRQNNSGERNLSVVISNMNPTERFKQDIGRAHGNEIYFDESTSFEEIVDAIKEKIEEIKDEEQPNNWKEKYNIFKFKDKYEISDVASDNYIDKTFDTEKEAQDYAKKLFDSEYNPKEKPSEAKKTESVQAEKSVDEVVSEDQEFADVSGKEITPEPKVKADLKTVLKELGISESDQRVYDLLKDVLPENRQEILEKFIEKERDRIYDIETSVNKAKSNIEKVNLTKKAEKEQEILDEIDSYTYGSEEGIYDAVGVDALIDKIDARLQTRLRVKEGTDLFPEDANIPELKKINKTLENKTDGKTITKFKQRTAKQIEELEPTVKDIERKAESGGETELNEAISEANRIIEDVNNSDISTRFKTIHEAQMAFGKKEITLQQYREIQQSILESKKKEKGKDLASSSGSNVSSFEERSGEGAESFKLFDRIKEMVKKYAPNSKLVQGYTGKNALGLFNQNTKNLKIKGLNDISVAFHEITHALDDSEGIVEGLPNELKNRLSEVYLQYYPKASEKVPNNTKYIEGYAMLLQKYIESPTIIRAEYGDLVKNLIEGEYAFPAIKEFLADANQMVVDYQQLAPLQKIGSRVVDEVRKDESPLKQKVKKAILEIQTQIFDDLQALENIDKEAGTIFTDKDVTTQLRMARNSAIYAENNLDGKKYIGLNNKGDYEIKHDFTWKTLTKDLSSRDFHGTDGISRFGWWLTARQVKSWYDGVNELTNQMDDIDGKLIETSDEAEIESLKAQKKELEDQRADLISIINNEGISEREAVEAYNEGLEEFSENAKMFDTLSREDILLLSNDAVRILDDEKKNKYLGNVGKYAPAKRAFVNEVVGDVVDESMRLKPISGGLGSLKKMSGSSKPRINPLLSAMSNHIAFSKKANDQRVINMIYDNLINNPDVFGNYFENIPLTAIPGSQGVSGFKESSDPTVLIAKTKNGTSKGMKIMDASIARVLQSEFSPQDVPLALKIMVEASRVFKTGTTGWFPPFILSNLPLDAVSRFVNTRTNIVPGISEPMEITKALAMKNSEERKFLREYIYLAGKTQTRMGWNRMAVSEGSIKEITQHKSMEALAHGMSRLSDFLSIPSNISEITPRATEYIRARKNGSTQATALELAGRVTGPFHHKGRMGGKVGQAWVQAVPYMNPILQVLDVTAERLKTREGLQRYAIASSLLGAVTGATLYTIFNRWDDDDKEKAVNLLKGKSPQELGMHLYIPDPYRPGEMIKIRVPETHMYISMAANMYMLDKYEDANYTSREVFDAATTPLPDQLQPWKGFKWLMSVTPQLPKNFIEVGANIQTFPEVRPIETLADQRELPENRFSPYTSNFAKYLAKTDLGRKYELSPKMIDHLVRGNLGRASGYFTGKPGMFNLEKLFLADNYINSTRQARLFFDKTEKYERYVKDAKDKLKKELGVSKLSDAVLMEEYNKIKDPILTKDEMSDIMNYIDYGEGIIDDMKKLNKLSPDNDPKEYERLSNQIMQKMTNIELGKF